MSPRYFDAIQAVAVDATTATEDGRVTFSLLARSNFQLPTDQSLFSAVRPHVNKNASWRLRWRHSWNQFVHCSGLISFYNKREETKKAEYGAPNRKYRGRHCGWWCLDVDAMVWSSGASIVHDQ